ncbi:Type 1 phosphatases regulator YPI1 [Sparassis crispa]|uniref:Type 1 phosphatases regulator n=1 Tax=Sparassis crispa TaxID=139825 RepID=A0A401H0V6_9APHY|nr:Type 1 phosphatases regulator YPI1 [Sparassis crispa]GBE88061.1 Type 1 phosphatases regulator YPI1 [Sparassis crispa]
MATRQRPLTPLDGSRTITLQDSQRAEDTSVPNAASSETVGALRLRGAPRNRQQVVWREDVVDNEGAGRKSSKICCIYHKPRKFDESSDEESSDSDSDSDSSCGHDHDHPHPRGRRDGPENANGDNATMRSGQGGVVHELEDDEDGPNVYEKIPGRKPKKTPTNK